MPSLRHTSGINCDKNAKRYLNSRLQSSLINIACFWLFISASKAGRVAQSVTCLVTDMCLTADPGVASSIKVRFHIFVEIDHEMISSVILLPSEGLSVTSESMCTNYWLNTCSNLSRKKCGYVNWTSRHDMTIAVYLGHKASKQTNNQ